MLERSRSREQASAGVVGVPFLKPFTRDPPYYGIVLLVACDREQARNLAQYRVDHLAFPVRLGTSSPSDTDSFIVSRPTGGGRSAAFRRFAE